MSNESLKLTAEQANIIKSIIISNKLDIKDKNTWVRIAKNMQENTFLKKKVGDSSFTITSSEEA